MRRVFIAIELPENIKDKLMKIHGGLEGAKWQRREQMHLTLSFIGNVSNHQLIDADGALRQIKFKPFKVDVNGLGIFGKPNRPRLLWTGVKNPKPIEDLHAKIHNALERASLPQDERSYLPHVTLARFDGSYSMRVDQFVVENDLLDMPPFEVKHFALIESHLGREGAHYDVLQRYDASVF